jgi:N utilization substance protein A
MNAFDLRQLIAHVAKDKGITQERLYEALESAMLKAAKKVFGPNKAIEAVFDEERGEVTLAHVIRIISEDDDDLEHEPEYDGASRTQQESRKADIERLTLIYDENQLDVEVARNEYALDLQPGQYIRLPILYQGELLSRQVTALKAERRGKKGPERDAITSALEELELRLDQERRTTQRYTERFGDLLLLDSSDQGFGRIAAQAAKSAIREKVKEAERDKIFEDFQGREEIETCEIRRFERGGAIVVALHTSDQEQTVEALLPREHQIPHETYRMGKQIRCVITEVKKDPDKKTTSITVSQRHENFIRKLFEQNVPEIYHGIVEIKHVARIFGEARGVKISVTSKDPNVDPAGACIGPNGSRVKLVEAEIGGDKIEIVPYSSEDYIYVCKALQPAHVSRILIDAANNTMDVTVPDDQLSKAIGKRGKNVRLASLLTGWKLNIFAESKMLERENMIFDQLAEHPDINPEALNIIWTRKGFRSLDQFYESTAEELSELPGVSAEDAEALIRVATLYYNQEISGQSDQGSMGLNRRWPSNHPVLTPDLCQFFIDQKIDTPDDLARYSVSDLKLTFSLSDEDAQSVYNAVRSL